ncbi:MAG: LamG domain-containing protein, partial [Planctomycetota bacterium]
MSTRLTFLIAFVFAVALVSGQVCSGVDPDLAGWWKLDGNAQDSSGNGHDGVIYSDPQWVAGYHSGALSFDGVDDRVEMPSTSSAQGFPATDGEVTWTLWMKTPATGALQTAIALGPAGAAHIQGNRSINVETSGLIMVRAHSVGALTSLDSTATVDDDEWHHVVAAIAFETDGANDTMRVYIDGDLSKGYETTTVNINLHSGPANDFVLTLGARGSTPFAGLLDDVRVYSRALTVDEVLKVMQGGFETSADPTPADGATDILRDTPLGWSPGQFAQSHDVYFGTAFDDVNTADRANPLAVLVSEGQTDTGYLPSDVLEFGQTYYWRVDEVNGAPDNTIFKGQIWSFTVEPFAYRVQSVTATSNGISDAGTGPENTVNGSGLNASDEHSVDAPDMWLAVPGADPLQIQYEFDGVYKLHEMLVWNYNVQFELMLGFGLKDVTVEHSENGADWTALGDVQLAQATARADYAANTAVAFGGVAARSVRMTVNSGYGPMGQFGLSEVRFLFVPVQAREPRPADGATEVLVGTALSWRAGREAVSHDVHLGADPEALAMVDSVSEASYAPSDLHFGTMYYWQIVEVNEAEAVSSWAGDIWSFATQAFAVIDDMESYDDEENRIYDAWLDGFVNDTGATVGYFEAPFAEKTIVNSGGQSMPLEYNNADAPFYSEAELDLGSANWTANGADTLRLFVSGQAPAFFEG